jgi:hypothetical protein
MALVHECAAPDCRVLTMGPYCLEHEQAEEGTRMPSDLIGAIKLAPATAETAETLP